MMNYRIPYPVRANIFAYPDYAYAKHQFEYFRIAVAAFSLFNFFLFIVDYDVLLASNGMISWEVTSANSFWFEPHLQKLTSLINPSVLLYSAILVYILSLTLLGLGIKARLMAVISFACFLLFSIQLHPYLYGVDLYQSVFLFFLCVFPSGHSLALSKNSLNETICAHQQIAIRVIQVYLMITYFSAGLGKVQMPSWFNGEFLFLSLSDPTYQFVPFPMDLDYHFFMVSGCVVVFLELLYPLLVLIPYVRSFVLLSVLGMHAFIIVFMGLVPFGVLLIIMNLIAWHPLLIQDYQSIIKFLKS